MSLANNRKAYHEYEMLDEYEAGIALTGTEIKSIRAGHVNINDAHIRIINSEAFLINAHISVYEHGNVNNHDPLRTRKLLLHKKELNYLAGKTKEQGLTLVPLKLYFKNRKVKLSMALARGKKLHDKRQSMKERDTKLEMQRALKTKSRG